MAIWPARFASDEPEDETPLGEDGIGLDSVEIAEFLMACEDRSGVAIPDPGTFEPPMVLASFHLGPIFSLGALLRQLPADVLAFAQNLPTGPSVRTVHIEGTEVDRSAAFLDGINHLRQNGFVFIAADG